jgi:hypothetical protein
VPADGKTDEAEAVAWKYAQSAWQELPRATLGHNADDLCFMTPAAFVYFLPRFLIDALENYRDPDSAIPEDIVFQLTRPERDTGAFDAKVALMSNAEKEAVAACLSEMQRMAEVDKSYLASRASHALASVWLQFLPGAGRG